MPLVLLDVINSLPETGLGPELCSLRHEQEPESWPFAVTTHDLSSKTKLTNFLLL
jgi:hypothetical protein